MSEVGFREGILSLAREGEGYSPGHRLTVRQLAMLVLMGDEVGVCEMSVRGLSSWLGIGKASVWRGLVVLMDGGLAKRVGGGVNGRVPLFRLTAAGLRVRGDLVG
jgi:hypothetical protein